MGRRRERSVVLACIGAAMACLALAACTQAPKFSVTDVQMTGQTDDGYVLTFTLLGENPNKIPLPLREVNYSLALDEDHVFQGKRSAQATIPAKGSQEITLPVAVKNNAAGLTPTDATTGPAAGVKAGYRLAGSIEYEVPGSISELLFDSKIRRPKAGFSENGTFQFTEEPMSDPATIGPPEPGGAAE